MKSYSQANRGRPFEDFLKFVHQRYQHTGKACVHKVPTEFLPIRNASGTICNCKVEGKSCVDYLGRYRNTPVAIEAKHEEGARISFSRVEPHQADYLDDFCREPEAVGIVIVSFGLRRFFAVPWVFWKAARDAWEQRPNKKSTKAAVQTVRAYGWEWNTTGMASASPEQLHPEWEIRAGGEIGLPYLEIIDRMKKGEQAQ